MESQTATMEDKELQLAIMSLHYYSGVPVADSAQNMKTEEESNGGSTHSDASSSGNGSVKVELPLLTEAPSATQEIDAAQFSQQLQQQQNQQLYMSQLQQQQPPLEQMQQEQQLQQAGLQFLQMEPDQRQQLQEIEEQQQQQQQQQHLQQLQLQQQLQQQQGVPPPQVLSSAEPPPIEKLVTIPPIIPPPEMHQIVYAIAPPLYVYPSMFSFYPMMMPEAPFSMGGVSNTASSYQSTLPMKIKKSPSNKDSSKKKQTRKTLWIPLSIENVFLNWFEKIGSTQYRCKRDACVGLIEAIADSGDIEDWVPEAQKIFNEDTKRKGRDLIWDKLNELGKTFCDEKRTWSLTFSAAVLKYCRSKDSMMDGGY